MRCTRFAGEWDGGLSRAAVPVQWELGKKSIDTPLCNQAWSNKDVMRVPATLNEGPFRKMLRQRSEGRARCAGLFRF